SFATALVAMTASAKFASSATINNWNVAGAGSWNTAANWNPANVPLTTEDATIGTAVALPAGTTAITLDADQPVYGVTANPASGKTLQINSGTPTTSALILLSTDTATGSGSFFAFSATSGTTQIGAPVQLGNASTVSSTATINSFVNASNLVFNGDIREAAG